MSGQLSSAYGSVEDEDDEEDNERARQIKELLFKTYRVPNQEGICVSEFVSDLGEIFTDKLMAAGGEPATALYQTLLNL